ncbi:MAG: glycoside hydrolase family 32 protein [Verrucomicrobiota bacterium]
MNPTAALATLTATITCTLAEPRIGNERYRPRYHFTAEHGYINDPNGLFFLDGTYHLFFQHDGIHEKSWGHATSTDLLHWKHLPDALAPRNGKPVFSGSAAIDHHNTTGFGTRENPPVVACFTEWGLGQSLAYSLDKGASWIRYDGNPVLTRPNDDKAKFRLSSRDPHIMWDEARKRWVLVMFDNLSGKTDTERGDHRHGFSIFTSPDLKDWTYRSHLDGFYVCPDIMKLPIEGEDSSSWVAMDWDQYAVGDFDGERFVPTQAITPLDFGPEQVRSANQSWKHLPDGRTIQICWIRGGNYPGMPFDQQLGFPTELSLRRINDQLHLCKQPIRELRKLHDRTSRLGRRSLAKGESATLASSSQSHDFEIELVLDGGDRLQLEVLGKKIILEPRGINCDGHQAKPAAPLTHLRLLSDITSLEIFGNHGEVTLSYHLLPPEKPGGITLSALEGRPGIKKAELREVRSIWR